MGTQSILLRGMSQTLRDLTGAPSTPAPLSESALVMIDCQNTYREGVMKLEGVEEALVEATALLQRARQAKRPIFHIRHDAGEGTPYDLTQSCGKSVTVWHPKREKPSSPRICPVPLKTPISMSS